jgi:hypothetical protein
VLLLRDGEATDTLLEVDRAGKVVWTWRAIEHLGNLIPARPTQPHDVTHFNSLQELPQNPWSAAGDSRFRPGNLLVSARNLNTIFIIDRASGNVVWSFGDGLDRQHEAVMNGPGLPGPGLIQIFNNRSTSFAGDRQSEVIEIDPRDGAVAWRFRTPGFFTHTAGIEQALPNGNVLVTSTRGGRVFEVTRKGELAWEWIPPYEPVRAVRVARDACPQLAALPEPARTAVAHPPGIHHVDRDAYRFARQGSRMKAVIDGTTRMVLKEESDCRELLLPDGSFLQVTYGVDRDRLRAAGRAAHPPQFAVRLHLTGGNGGGEDVDLLRDTVGLEAPSWRQKTLRLDTYGLRPVRLCVEIDGGAPAPANRRDRFAYWEQPTIATRRDFERAGGEDDDDRAAPKDLTPEELEVRRKHLKSLGYIG